MNKVDQVILDWLLDEYKQLDEMYVWAKTKKVIKISNGNFLDELVIVTCNNAVHVVDQFYKLKRKNNY